MDERGVARWFWRVNDTVLVEIEGDKYCTNQYWFLWETVQSSANVSKDRLGVVILRRTTGVLKQVRVIVIIIIIIIIIVSKIEDLADLNQ